MLPQPQEGLRSFKIAAANIGWRYDEDTIAAMLRIKWWDWSHEELAARVRDFDDVEGFISKYDK